MTRFLVLFAVLLVIALSLIAAAVAQAGYSLLDPKMTPMLLAAVLIAAYVSWRIDGILKRREESQGHDPDAAKEGFGKKFLSPKPSRSQSARAARVAAQRKKLIAEGKLEAEPEPPKSEENVAPTRVSQSAPIKDRMAARAERVRQAKEQGKI